MHTRFAALLAALCAATPLPAQPIDFSAYHTPAQVDFEVSRFATRFPSLVQIVTLGNSLEGRPIRAIKISDNPGTDEPAEADVVFVALHHAREWLATETALFVAEQILMRYATDPQVQADVNDAQIWIVPVVNPDGYAHTVAVGGYRYWRKNRRNNGGGTFGVDLNRNWGYQWGLLSGSSNVSSDDTYHGTGPFSEPELVVLRNFLDSRKARLESFVSYHTFSELWLRPWSYTTTDAPGEQTLASLYERSRDAIAAVHSHVYSPTIWYTSSGEATDWVWQEHRVAAFTPELRPASGGLSGFSPPASEIIPTGQESVPAALALLHDAADTEVWIKDHNADTGAEPSAVWTGTGWTNVFWVSPDIWVDPGPLTEGTVVPLHVRVRNASGAALTNVRVEAYWTDPSISTEFPSPGATLIGAQTVTVPAGGTVVDMNWSVPSGTNAGGERHWCVGVVIKHARDMPLTTQATRSSNVAFHNFWPAEALAGTAVTLSVTATNFLNVDSELQVVVGGLPPGWRAQVPDPRELYPDTTYAGGGDRRDPNRTGLQRKGRLLRATGTLLRPGERVLIPVRVTPPAGAPPGTTADVNIHGGLIPLVAGERPVHGNGFTYRVTVRAP
ncbi:MAG TPA: M14 family metallopeptidase [Longimicrobium sp.]|nr:M14 family metallopeptidase [Longimicrobium sp.]